MELNKDDAAIESIQALLSDPRWEHRTFNKLRERFKGMRDIELRKLLVAAGATAKKAKDGAELWSLEGNEMPNESDDKPIAHQPRWAVWLRQQIDAINWVLTGLIVLVGTVGALWLAVINIDWTGPITICDQSTMTWEKYKKCLSKK